MISKETEKEIREYEKEGIKVIVLGSENQVIYSTDGLQKKKPEYCDGCPSFRLYPDPDPTDWFRDEDKKAVCTKLNVTFLRSLELPNEWVNITRPLFCPKLSNTLTEEEKKKAEDLLRFCRRNF